MHINIVDGLCGSGKSHGLVRALSNPSNKTVIAVPTTILADQYGECLSDAKASNYSVHHGKNSVSEIKIQAHNAPDKSIMVITQKAHELCGSKVFAGWDVVYDEIPQVDFFYELSLPYNHSLITEHLELIEGGDAPTTMYRLCLKDHALAHKFNKRNFDDMDNIVKPIINHLLSGNLMFVDKASWNKIIVRGEITDDRSVDYTHGNQLNKLYFLAIRTPDAFNEHAKVTMMGANFEHSMAYWLWGNLCGTRFKHDTEIENKLRYKQHNNGHLLNIKYIHEKNWSKTQAGKVVDGSDVRRSSLEKAKRSFNTNDVLYVSNNDNAEIPTGWSRCPVISLGLNSYMDKKAMYFDAALNRAPKHIKMLTDLGMTSEYIARATTHEVVYQNICRTAIRDDKNTDPIEIMVADKGMADAIARLFPNCTYSQLDGIEKKVVGSKQSAFKRRERVKELNDFYMCSEEFTKSLIIKETVNRSRHEEPIDLQLNYYSDRFTTQRNSVQEILSPERFVSDMESYSKANVLDDKHDNFLLNTAVMRTHSDRKKKNVVLTTAIVLDIDDGDLPHEEFHRIFSEVYPFSHFVTNSAGRRAGHDKYRAFFFVKEAMTPDTHEMVFDHLVDLLERQGYYTVPLANAKAYKKRILKRNPLAMFTGIDMSKRSVNSLFYAPCTIKGFEEYQFFDKFKCGYMDFAKHAIDTTLITKYAPQAVELTTLEFESDEVIDDALKDNKPRNWDKVNAIIDSLSVGNRSYPATQVAGYIKTWSHEDKASVYDRLVNAGIDKGAKQSVKKYAQLY